MGVNVVLQNYWKTTDVELEAIANKAIIPSHRHIPQLRPNLAPLGRIPPATAEPHQMAHQDYLTAFNRMSETYSKETDRAAAVLGGSFVESVLGDLLRTYLVDDKKVGELFDGDRPLATFSARIHVGYALGLLPPNIRSDLDLIRRIRNHFAHHPEETSFDVAPVSDICDRFPWLIQSRPSIWMDFEI